MSHSVNQFHMTAAVEMKLAHRDLFYGRFTMPGKLSVGILSRFARVVKGVDLKSTAERRVGSNPAGDDCFGSLSC